MCAPEIGKLRPENAHNEEEGEAEPIGKDFDLGYVGGYPLSRVLTSLKQSTSWLRAPTQTPTKIPPRSDVMSLEEIQAMSFTVGMRLRRINQALPDFES